MHYKLTLIKVNLRFQLSAAGKCCAFYKAAAVHRMTAQCISSIAACNKVHWMRMVGRIESRGPSKSNAVHYIKQHWMTAQCIQV